MDLEPANIQILIVSFLFSVPILVFLIISQWKIFKKAGEHGWAVLIPFYNAFVMFKIAFGSGGYLFLILISSVVGGIFNLFLPILAPIFAIPTFVLTIATPFKLAKAFGKGTGFGFGLLFLPFIFQPILAFGDAVYVGPGPGSGPSFSGNGRGLSGL